MSENIIQIINDIKDNLNKDYYKALLLIEKYFTINNAGIYDYLLYDYIFCLIKLNYISEAEANIELLQKLYPNFYKPIVLIIQYIKCGCEDKAEKIIRTTEISVDKYFKIARTYLLYGNINKAKEYLTYCYSHTVDENLKKSAINQLQKINRCIKKSSFIEQSYDYFKRNGNILAPGMVIHAKTIEHNQNKDDKKANKRPYLVFKVIEDQIYALPLSTKVDKQSEKGYFLYMQKYPNFDGDRKVKDSIVRIAEKDVENIYEIINDYDYEKVINYLYHSLLFNSVSEQERNQMLIDECLAKIDVSKEDVICLYNTKDNLKKYYYILEIEDEQYKVLELNNHDGLFFTIKDKNIKFIRKTKPIIYVVKLKLDDKLKLQSELGKQYQKSIYI